MKYVRFVTNVYKNGLGIFQSRRILKSKISALDNDELDELIAWFNVYIPIPDRFSKSKNAREKHRKGYDYSARKAVCWYKKDANEAINKSRRYCEILEKYIRTEMLKSNNPGMIVYEDEYQVAAIGH